ncbi:hypothetical protein [Marinobacter zhejiangensis]|uniref:Lipoprotein n=1 Tax=Marinobacter zhejiangensis TaxID=488535 RepID=A0A1I4PXY0_9GAMM|nr:hypothetical protein [Marinobacter zhejiangensis]SFM32677.1 hypothetical protein SAMN04487963_2064 [Marinobacter zhejiangensis]
MLNMKGTFSILLPLVFAGCTNVAGGMANDIIPPPSSTLSSEVLFSVAGDYFSAEGYQCRAESEPAQLRCSKPLRELFIHQTRAVVQIIPGGGESGRYILATTRWDEGLIPGEFISSEFSNPDIGGFCDYLKNQGLGGCRPRG